MNRDFSRVIFTNKNSDVLVIKEKRNPFPLWALPGGKIELNECPVHTAKREVKEELDINIQIPKLEFIQSKLCKVGNYKWTGFFYYYPYPVSFNIKESQILDAQYKPLKEIVGLNAHHDCLYHVLEKHFNSKPTHCCVS